jgi:hypothetical protein
MFNTQDMNQSPNRFGVPAQSFSMGNNNMNNSMGGRTSRDDPLKDQV